MPTSSSADRIPSYAEFWPYYISEHRSALSRRLHFVGTTGFVLILMAGLFTAPLRMGLALGLSAGLVLAGFRMESRRSAAPLLLGVIGVCTLANPFVLLGVLWAYGFAWFGHFRVEGNRPATFVYPLWSLASDFKMVGLMWSGRLWTGDARDIAPLAVE
jgi:hypothetical protein